jgi:hypothetical protein
MYTNFMMEKFWNGEDLYEKRQKLSCGISTYFKKTATGFFQHGLLVMFFLFHGIVGVLFVVKITFQIGVQDLRVHIVFE